MSASASEIELLLEAWERGQSSSPARRSLLLLGLACPGAAAEELLAAPLGWRNRALALLHQRWFGPRLEAYAECPACAQRLELSLPFTQMFARAGFSPHPLTASFEHREFTVEFRAPSTADLIGLEGCKDAAGAPRELASACILRVSGPSGELTAARLPDDVIEELAARMQELDPLAEIQVELNCDACGHRWQTLLDLSSFLWRELAARARRLILEVDALARVYGWSERDILALSSFRRRCYLELQDA